jgi:hypothetical protein
MKFSDSPLTTGVGHDTVPVMQVLQPHPHIFKFFCSQLRFSPIFFLSCALPVLQKQVATLAIAIFYSTVVTIHNSTPVEPCLVHETQIVQHTNSLMHKIMKQVAVAAVAQA